MVIPQGCFLSSLVENGLAFHHQMFI